MSRIPVEIPSPIPHAARSIQVNHCRMPDCGNYGVPASTKRVKSGPSADRDPHYTVQSTNKGRVSIFQYEMSLKAGRDSNKPVQAIVLMALLYLIYVSEAALGAGAWTFLMIVFLLLILRFGIYRHLAGYDEDQYFSRGAWAAAIAINIFGVAVLSLSLF